MKQPPDIYQIDNLLHGLREHPVHCEVYPGKIVPARPERLGGIQRRFRAAWLVFTGRADALDWCGQ